VENFKYLQLKEEFLEYSYLALSDQFSSRKKLATFFDSIDGDEQKNKFLETSSFYLFLVKRGEWVVDVPRLESRIGYLTETYQYIALFSLIESLNNNNHHIDFYSFLERRKSKVEFPIKDMSELKSYYHKYKEEFGSIQQSVSFFRSLNRQECLIKKIQISGTDLTIESLSNYLYQLRSKFVHEATLVLNMSKDTHISRKGSKIVTCKLSIKDLMSFFEEGLVCHFKSERETS
jgi:hypothetical protein